MPALPPYMPAQDGMFTSWLNNFSTLITATPAAYGILPVDAANIQSLNTTWANAFGPVNSPTTKTAATVGAKNTAKIVVKAQIRTYAQTIANNPGVAISAKLALGLNPKTSTPSPITAPATYPGLTLQSTGPLTVTLSYRDSSFSSNKAKPYGVTQCRVYGMASTTPVTDKTLLPLIATPTKSPFILDMKPADIGMKFYVAARWAIQSGDLGPWSSMLSFTVMDS